MPLVTSSSTLTYPLSLFERYHHSADPYDQPAASGCIREEETPMTYMLRNRGAPSRSLQTMLVANREIFGAWQNAQ